MKKSSNRNERAEQKESLQKKSLVISPQDLMSECTVNMAWQWDNYPDSCLSSLQWVNLVTLQGGQSQNQHVQQLYAAAYSYFGRDVFFDILCTSSVLENPTVDETKANLIWQYQNNTQSLVNAYKDWEVSLSQPHNDLQNDLWAHYAVYWLLSGQRQNTHVMDLYRACFRENRTELFQIVQSVLGPQSAKVVQPSKKDRQGRK